MKRILEHVVRVVLLLAVALAWAHPGIARVQEGDPEYTDFKNLEKEWQVGEFAPAAGQRVQRPADIPDIFGPGAVLTVGNVFMKITNYGLDGNPFPYLSTDPSGQWPGASGVEYLSFIGFAVGAVNPYATDPTAVRRVSYSTEWRPPTLDPEDRMYRSYDGIVNGQRFVNDDGDFDPLTGDARIDEDFLDGRDNDGDGLIDEDFGAVGQMMYSCVIRDDTPQAINTAAAERHVPLGLEAQHTAWAYSVPGYTDFNVLQYDIYNRSGHDLDSVFIGFRDDMDCGPTNTASYWADDYNVPYYPHGDFIIQTKDTDLRLQPPNDRAPGVNDVSPDSALCPRFKIRVQGWSCVDNDGDITNSPPTPGMATMMLIDHTIDPTGVNGPRRPAIRSFRSFTNGTPYTQGGPPTIDQQRFEFMSNQENLDLNTGFINQKTGLLPGDYADWVSFGPWLVLPAGGHLSVTLAFGVRNGTIELARQYLGDYALAVDPAAGAVTDPSQLTAKYPSLDNAIAAQVAFEGSYEVRPWPYLTDFHGRETPVKAPTGQLLYLQGCRAHDPTPRQVNDRQYSWFDFDCDYCTGAFSKSRGGLFHHTWAAESPPPNPNTNLSASYNYSANPDRRFIPAGDHQVVLAWDNLSETTPDPKTSQFDFRGYKIWKVSDWTRPVGASGPAEDDWTLLATYTLFDAKPTNAIRPCPAESIGPGKPCGTTVSPGDTLWPSVYIPQANQYKTIKLYAGDLWDRQSGAILRPDPTVQCTNWPDCKTTGGLPLGSTGGGQIFRTSYPVGHYHIVDSQVKDGFIYFYSITAFDSSGQGATMTELNSRRSAVEAEGVIPQAAADTVHGGKNVWVVPNPYRGYRDIHSRPSSWDLTPNATDPTGTHIDFFGLPRGQWKIKIFTVSGDFVQQLNSTDQVNESIRSPVATATGTRPGYNTQADNPNDGQARWNLISRNGQDVVSGIYLFTVEVGGTVKHRGKFVIIR